MLLEPIVMKVQTGNLYAKEVNRLNSMCWQPLADQLPMATGWVSGYGTNNHCVVNMDGRNACFCTVLVLIYYEFRSFLFYATFG